MRGILLTVIALAFVMSLAGAQIYDNCEIYGNCEPVTTTEVNQSVLNVNHSNSTDFWDNLDTPDDFTNGTFSGFLGIGRPNSNLGGVGQYITELYSDASNIGLLIHEDAGTHNASLRLRRGGGDWELLNVGNFLIKRESDDMLRIGNTVFDFFTHSLITKGNMTAQYFIGNASLANVSISDNLTIEGDIIHVGEDDGWHLGDWPDSAGFSMLINSALIDSSGTNYTIIQQTNNGQVFFNSGTTMNFRVANVQSSSMSENNWNFEAGDVDPNWNWFTDGLLKLTVGSLQIDNNFTVVGNTTLANVSASDNISASFYYGNGSFLTGITGDNVTWNQTRADELYVNLTGDVMTGPLSIINTDNTKNRLTVGRTAVQAMSLDVTDTNARWIYTQDNDGGVAHIVFWDHQGAQDMDKALYEWRIDGTAEMNLSQNEFYVDPNATFNKNVTITEQLFVDNLTVAENVSAKFYQGNGSFLTGITHDNVSWNQTRADELYQALEDQNLSTSVNVSFFNGNFTRTMKAGSGAQTVVGSYPLAPASFGAIYNSALNGFVDYFVLLQTNGVNTLNSVTSMNFRISNSQQMQLINNQLIFDTGGVTDNVLDFSASGILALTSGSFFIDGTEDRTQLTVQGHGSQATDYVVFENSGGTHQQIFRANGGVIFNEDGNSVSTRIEGANEPSLFIVDGTSDQVNISGDINQLTGNSTINLFYGELWLHNGLTVDLSAINVPVSIFNINSTWNNGFIYDGNGTLTAQVGGVYTLSLPYSFSGGVNGEYHFGLGINGDMQGEVNGQSMNKTHGRRTIGTANQIGGTPGGGLVCIAVDDNITMMVMDTNAPVADPQLQTLQLTLVRIGDC